MRMARRLGVWGRKNTQKAFVWEVYDYTQTMVELSDESSFRASTKASCMASSSYTVSANGFTLVDATQTIISAISKNQFIVAPPTVLGDTAIEGKYLYKCTGYSQSGPQWILYVQKYGVDVSRGNEALSTVSSDTLDYPVDGVQGDKWYVLVENNSSLYIYGKYTVQKVAVENGSGTQTGVLYSTSVNAADSYTIEKGTSSQYQFVLTNPTQKMLSNALRQYIVSFTNTSSAKGSTLYYLRSVPSITQTSAPAQYYQYSVGDGQGEFLEYITDASKAYPINGSQDDYWYVLLSSPNS